MKQSLIVLALLGLTDARHLRQHYSQSLV